jgi:alpha-1,6-mannosyltransferase
VVVLIALTYTRLPWRPLQPVPAPTRQVDPEAETLQHPETPETPGTTPRSEAAPDAYADST